MHISSMVSKLDAEINASCDYFLDHWLICTKQCSHIPQLFLHLVKYTLAMQILIELFWIFRIYISERLCGTVRLWQTAEWGVQL